MADYQLVAQFRDTRGKSHARRQRRQGRIPGVYYFHRQTPLLLSVDAKDFYYALRAHAHLFDLQLGGKSHTCIIKEIQYDPVSDEPVHIDFMGVDLQEVIHFRVPVHITGTAVGVKMFGGVLEQHIWELEVKCQVTNLPDALTVDVTHLNLGDSISVSDLKQEGLEIMAPPTASIVSVVHATGAKSEEAETPAETETESTSESSSAKEK